MTRTVHIRDLDDDVYEMMWILRRMYKCRNWNEFMRTIIVKMLEKEVKEKWL